MTFTRSFWGVRKPVCRPSADLDTLHLEVREPASNAGTDVTPCEE